MTKDQLHVLVLQILRWHHFFFGIVWIGTLYWFNLVQTHADKALDDAAKRIVLPNHRGRSLWWFRWGAMITFLSGWLYLIYEQFIQSDTAFMGGWTKEPKNQWILFGALLGTIMWFNVWFVIWPRQKRIIEAVAAGQKPDDAMVAVAGRFSRINFHLSIPMLFAMGARHHFAAIGWKGGFQTGIAMLVTFVVGVAIGVHILMAAGKVGSVSAK